MATLNKFPCFLSLSSHKLFLNQQQQQQQQKQQQKQFSICVCSVKKSRSGRKVKSNVELCNDIREFLSAVGLPEGHVPSMKELSDHGRNDLANIVRRRGYKLIRDLLSNPRKADTDGSDIEKGLAEGLDAVGDCGDILTGQDKKLNDVVEDGLLLTEFPIIKNHCGSSDIDQEHNSSESLAELPLEEKALYHVEQQVEEVKSMIEESSLLTCLYDMEQQDKEKIVVEENSLLTPSDIDEQHDKGVLSNVEDKSLSTEVSIINDYHGSLNDLNTGENTCMPVETSAHSFFEDTALYKPESKGKKVTYMAEDVSLSNGVSSVEYYADNINIVPGLNSGDHSCMPVDSTANLSLEERVAKFVRSGDLDVIEGNPDGMLSETAAEESMGFTEPENANDIWSNTPSEEKFEHKLDKSNAALTLNGSLLTSKKIMPHMTVDHPIRNEHLSAEGLATADLDKDLDVKKSKRDNQVEIDHLKFMLHQKELELSQLNEQIEKEKLALSALQTKAETEIGKAQRLISEKDAELLAAEESLSGLVEVKIQYCGDGEIVEVSGSFNGWNLRIKMDPQPSSIITDHVGSRSSISSLQLRLPA